MLFFSVLKNVRKIIFYPACTRLPRTGGIDWFSIPCDEWSGNVSQIECITLHGTFALRLPFKSLLGLADSVEL